jgi:hypothetical protein
MTNLQKNSGLRGEVIEKTSIAFRAVISPVPTAIRVLGLDDECVRLQLDIYPEDEGEVHRLMELRGRELFVVLTQEG